jgi:hypothetical protein
MLRADNFRRFLVSPAYQGLFQQAKMNEEVELEDFLNEIYQMKLQKEQEEKAKKKKR